MSRKQVIYHAIKAIIFCLITAGFGAISRGNDSQMIYIFIMLLFNAGLRTKEIFNENEKEENYKEYIIDSAVVLVFYLVLLVPTNILFALNIDVPFITVVYLATALIIWLSKSFKNSTPAILIYVVVFLAAFYLIYRLGYIQDDRYKLTLLILLGTMVAYSALVFLLKTALRKEVEIKDGEEQRGTE